MYAIESVINNEKNDAKRADFQERLDIIEHKIKFMDKVNLLVLDTNGNAQLDLSEITVKAGARLTTDPISAHYIVVFERNKQLNDLLSVAPSLLNSAWPAAKNRVSLLADCYDEGKADDLVNMVEDIAEILHPGQFVFGFEGDKWIRFNS